MPGRDVRPDRVPARSASCRTCSRWRREGSSGSSCGRRGGMTGRADPDRVRHEPALVRLEDARGHARDGRRPRDAARRRPALELQLVEMRFDTGTHETYQLLADGGLDALGDPRQVRELVHMIRGGREAARRRRRRRVRGGRGLRRARQRAARGAPDRRRAVEHVDRLRRGADPEGLPAARGGDQPRARAAALPDRARLREHRAARRLVRVRRAADGRDARDPAAVRRERPGRLGARARHDGDDRRRSSTACTGSAR